MKKFSIVLFCLAAILFLIGQQGFALDSLPKESKHDVKSAGVGTSNQSDEIQITLKVPLGSAGFSQFPVAVVNDDPISMEELTEALALSHSEREYGKTQTRKINYRKILDRLINGRLVAQEGANMGFEELPEYKSAMDRASRATLEDLLKEDVLRGVAADPAEVEKVYKDAVLEWKIKSILFEKEEDATAMSEGMKAGKSFEELAKSAAEEKKAKGGDKEAVFMRVRDLAPDISKAVVSLGTGSVTPVIKIEQPGKSPEFAIVKLEEKRYADDPHERMLAEKTVLKARKVEIINGYKETLYKKYVKIKDKVIDKVDYESPKANFDELLTDTRVVAEIKDEKPLTVGDLTAALMSKEYHGLAKAAQTKRVNQEKRQVLTEVINKILIKKEALNRGFDKSPEYVKAMREAKLSALFDLFLTKVVYPDFVFREADVKEYYDAHRKEFLYPETIRMTSLVFRNKRDADWAMKKLARGSDINWVRANADGLVIESDKDLRSLNGKIAVTREELGESISKALANVKAGDFRLYTGYDGYFYVFAVEDVMHAQQQPFEEVRELIRRQIFSEKLNQSVEDWFVKLRAAGEVKIYLSETGK